MEAFTTHKLSHKGAYYTTLQCVNVTDALLTQKLLQTSVHINISSKTVCRELHGTGFRGRAAPVDMMCRYTCMTKQNSHSTLLRKDVCMYVHHEVSSCRVLHDKTHMFWRLEACKQVDQEGMVGAVDDLKDPLLTHQTGDGQTEERGRDGEGGGMHMRQSLCNYEVNELLSCSRDVVNVVKHSYLSTSSRATMSPFFRALMAYWLPVFLYSDSST